jgi:hypothetical protein
MLILCYGMAKGGSTLTFELVKGMLESIGHAQVRLPDGPVDPGHPINYIASVDAARTDALLRAAGERWIAVKTHAGFRPAFFPVLEGLQRSGRVHVIASYRDPRDVCLSLLDAGARAVAGGHPGFSRFVDMETAVADVQAQTEKFRRWASVRGALRLEYEMVAFSPDAAIDRIERHLELVCDRAAARRHAFEQAFTQQNKMKRRRFEDELNEEERRRLTEIFGEFLREAGNDAWFTSYREHLLVRAERATRKRDW